MKYQCGDCGMIFDEDEIETWEESRGEFWGMPAYETVSGCPYCHSGDIGEYEEAEESEDGEDDEDESD